MNTQPKTLIFLSILLMLSSIVPKLVLADGMIIKPDPYSDRWDYVGESNQQAFINYEKGLEKMILSIGIEEADKDAIWLFPVPSEPDRVVIDVVTEFPRLNGENITKKAKSNLLEVKKVLPATQIYTIPFIDWWGMGTYEVSVGGDAPPPLSAGGRPSIETDVIVYEHIEKEGIITEVITAKTAGALYQYFQDKNLKIKEGTIPVLDYYIGKEFTFVASWISQTDVITPNFGSKQRGIFVTFPTQKIYYPLFPTSVYGSESIPISIRIIGHVSPKIFKDIESYTKIEYFIDDYIKPEYYVFIDDILGLAEWPENFYNGSSENVKYTKIEIEAPSKFFTEDLWIMPRSPIGTYYSLFFAQHPWVSGTLLLILSSVIAGIIAGWIVFKDLRMKNCILKLALVGLSNCLSVMGVAITTIFIRTKEKDKNIEPLINKIKEKGYSWRRKTAIFLLPIAAPLSIIGLLSFISQLQLLFGPFNFHFEDTVILLLSITPIAALIFALLIKKIKIEDRPLFAQLKSAGYSSWTFNPKDRLKFAFVPIFSVVFLIISWLILKLIEITV